MVCLYKFARDLETQRSNATSIGGMAGAEEDPGTAAENTAVLLPQPPSHILCLAALGRSVVPLLVTPLIHSYPTLGRSNP